MAVTQDRTLMAAGAILIYALLIAYADNYVRVIAAEGGLWQFHATPFGDCNRADCGFG